MKVHSKEERGLAAECKGNKKFIKKKRKSQDGRRLFRVRIFSSTNILSPKCELQSVSSLLLQHSSLSKAMPRSERGREKAATFFLSPKWLRAGRKAATRKSGAPRPAQGRAGRFIEHLSLVSLSSLMPFCPISRLSDRTNGVQLCCQSIRNSTRPTTQGKAPTVNE